MTTKEGVESVQVTSPGKAVTAKTSVGGKVDYQIHKPHTLANSPHEVVPTSPGTHTQNVAMISNGSGKKDKSPTQSAQASKRIPHYLRPSTSSYHHYCKYGVKPETPKQSHRHVKIPKKAPLISNKTPPSVPKPAVPKTAKAPKRSTPSSPLGASFTQDGDSSQVSPREKIAVDKSTLSKSENMPSKPSPEKKTKTPITSHTLSRASKPALNGNVKTSTPPANQALNGHGNAKTTSSLSNHGVNGHGNAKMATKYQGNVRKYTPSPNHSLNVNGNTRKSTLLPKSISSPKSTLSPNQSPNVPSNTKIVSRTSDKKAISKTKGNPLIKAEKKTAMKSDSSRSVISPNPKEERPNKDGTVEVCADQEEIGVNDQVCAKEGEDVQFYGHSHISDESVDEEHANGAVKHIDNVHGHSVEQYCNECNDGYVAPTCPPCESTDSDKYTDEKNDDFGSYGEGDDHTEQDGESLAEEYPEDLYSEYSEEYSEYTGSPGSEPQDEREGHVRVRKEHQRKDHGEGGQGFETLRFRRGRIIDPEEEQRRLERRKFRRGRVIDHSNPKPEPENVELRHQEEQRRKAAEEWMLNHVIEETVNKLSHTRKSKVKALVGAFETVISLKESETVDQKHVGSKDSSQLSSHKECTTESSKLSTLQECTGDPSQLSTFQERPEVSSQASSLQDCTKDLSHGTEDSCQLSAQCPEDSSKLSALRECTKESQ